MNIATKSSSFTVYNFFMVISCFHNKSHKHVWPLNSTEKMGNDISIYNKEQDGCWFRLKEKVPSVNNWHFECVKTVEEEKKPIQVRLIEMSPLPQLNTVFPLLQFHSDQWTIVKRNDSLKYWCKWNCFDAQRSTQVESSHAIFN